MITPVYAAALALFYVFLSSLIQFYRFKNRKPYGSSGDSVLAGRVRAHANFIEYTPLILILAFFVEITGGSRSWLYFSLSLFTLGRIFHAFSLIYFERVKGGFIFRILGMVATHIVTVSYAYILIKGAISE